LDPCSGSGPTTRFAPAPTTRFAPAPTGRLHLGHLANAIYVWGLARRVGGRVILRIEDHDRQRCRPEYEAALLDDLDRLGIAADEPSTDELRAGSSRFRQSDNGPVYEAALEGLGAVADVYGCDCSRATFTAWREAHGRAWSGPGCPGGCRSRGLERRADLGLRVALGDGDEAWDDLLLGPRMGQVAADGDLLVRDRNGNWTYALCVVVDDLRHGVDLVVRGEDLLDATPSQIRLGRSLGRAEPPRFAHHPLVRRRDGPSSARPTATPRSASCSTAVEPLTTSWARPPAAWGWSTAEGHAPSRRRPR
jgi:glutamyl/glutaminyl-tRNA synthetase